MLVLQTLVLKYDQGCCFIGGEPRWNNQPAEIHWQSLSHNVILLTHWIFPHTDIFVIYIVCTYLLWSWGLNESCNIDSCTFPLPPDTSAVLNLDTKLCKENANFCQFLKQKLNWFGLGCLMPLSTNVNTM
jgi:hypothetical protein